MKVKMLRSLGRIGPAAKDKDLERLEGQCYDYSEDEAKALIERGLAEPAKDQAPAKVPDAAEAPVTPATFGDAPHGPRQGRAK